MTALQIERAIHMAALKLAWATTEEGKREAWDELCRHHAMRSPEHVAYLEEQRGLR